MKQIWIFLSFCLIAGEAKAAAVTISGRRVNCPAATRVTMAPDLDGSSAEARVDGYGGQIIRLDKRLFPRRSPEEQWFIFHHECAHFRVGGSETRADLLAVDRAFAEGWLDLKALRLICSRFDQETGDGYPSGYKRCQNIMKRYRMLKSQAESKAALAKSAKKTRAASARW